MKTPLDLFCQEFIKVHNLAINNLTEQQTAEAFRQAIACGDFQRYVTQAGAQQVVYIPFAREQELQGRIKELENKLFEGRADEEQRDW